MFINGKETNAELFAYDGCHKIYLIEDSNTLRVVQEDYPHLNIHHIMELEETYNNSCPLKFIDSLKYEDNEMKFKVIVPQCTENVTFSYTRKELVS